MRSCLQSWHSRSSWLVKSPPQAQVATFRATAGSADAGLTDDELECARISLNGRPVPYLAGGNADDGGSVQGMGCPTKLAKALSLSETHRKSSTSPWNRGRCTLLALPAG